MDDTKPAAAYYRVSKARDEMGAPRLYEDQIRRYCAYREFTLGEIFADLDFSGFRGAKPRPALEELKDRRHEFSTVIVPKLARFGRSVKELVELFDLFDSDGIALVFLDMNVDTSTSQGRLLRHIMAAFAEYESDVKADYARANHRMVRAQGRPWGGRPPFGYERHASERTYVINEQRAEIVRRTFDLYGAGASLYEIARRLNRRGDLRPSGAEWRPQQIGRVLDNPAYPALCVVDDKIIDAVWDPIVSRAQWEAVRERRRRDVRRTRQLRVAKGGPYLLSGLLFCGHCGRKLHHRSRKNTRNGTYLCVDPKGHRCAGGSVDCNIADDFISQRFLDRCNFSIDHPGPVTFNERGKRWSEASMLDRRRLLSLAIERVVLVPWPGGENPQRRGGKSRELAIEWRSIPREPLMLVTSPVPESKPKRRVSHGRVDMMRDAEVAIAERQRAERSARAKAYYEEWARIRRRS
jgi:DNA invertase Pin-like site-specific DNA recombinase